MGNKTAAEYKTKDDFVIITGATEPVSDTDDKCEAIIKYPNGFNKDNCVVISIMFKGINSSGIWTTGSLFNSNNTLLGGINSKVSLKTDNIQIQYKNILLSNNDAVFIPKTSEYSTGSRLSFKLILMKVS